MKPLSSDLRARVLADVSSTPAPTRDAERRRAALLTLFGALGTIALFFMMGGIRPGTRSLPAILLATAMAFGGAVLLPRLAAGGRSMLGASRTAIVLACSMVATSQVLIVFATLALTDSSEPIAFKSHVGCAVMMFAQGALPLGVLLLPRRGSDPVHPAVTGAVLGMSAGAWAATMAHLRCPHVELVHGLAAHALPVVIFAAAGALLGHLTLRLRYESPETR